MCQFKKKGVIVMVSHQTAILQVIHIHVHVIPRAIHQVLTVTGVFLCTTMHHSNHDIIINRLLVAYVIVTIEQIHAILTTAKVNFNTYY